jgi:predicted TIM-barrel fold metal-dependent hydrolase
MYAPPKEPISFLLRGYFPSDLLSAGLSQRDLQLLQNDEVPTEKKWPIFKHFWLRTEHTAYAREVKYVIQSYGEKEITLESLKRFNQRVERIAGDKYIEFLNSLNIKAVLINIFRTAKELKCFLKGEIRLPDCFKLLIPLPVFHALARSFQGIQEVTGIIDRTATSLDEFLDIVREIFRRLKERGVIGVKDQSAYQRSIKFSLSTREKAERLFNKCLADPNNSLGWPEAKPLDDFLFHEYMRFARDLNLPVQIHTGHMAGIRNRVNKANASLFTQVLEVHQEVNFDVFHGNWPYMGDMLFLAKNYPNVYMNLCWLHIIDPIYATELLERAVLVVPHKKINGFGGDYWAPELIPAHLSLAQDNIARALSNLVSRSWISENEAINIAANWLFNNPNELFKLGFKPHIP